MLKIFKNLFRSAEPSDEEKLLVSLQRLSGALQSCDSHWAEMLAKLHQQIQAEFSSGAPTIRRYQLARRVEQLFGGMGTLNDIVIPLEGERLREELYLAVEDLLRVYWRALGRPSQATQFTPLPVGSFVRLIPGAVRCFERDETPVVVTDTPPVRSQIWQVVRYEGPDITGMPSYHVQHDNTFMIARHESLEIDTSPSQAAARPQTQNGKYYDK